MINIENINENIRNYLEDIYITLQDKYGDDAGIKYYELLDELKDNKPNVYEIIVSIMFLDTIRLLIDKYNKNFITEEEKIILEYLKELNNIDDLLEELEENKNLLSIIINGPFKFNRLNVKGKATMLLVTPIEYANQFNKFHYLEMMCTFKERTKEEIINLYKETKSYQDVLNVVDVLYLGNIKGFSKLLLFMIRTFYKWKKVILLTHPESISNKEIDLINIIESNSIDDAIYKISCDFDLIEIIVESFIFYETNDMSFKEEIEELYNKLVSDEIKIKLKEV